MNVELLGLALDRLVARCDDAHGDWNDVLRRANVTAASTQRLSSGRGYVPTPRRRALVAAALLVVVVFGVLMATPAFGVRDAILGLFGRTNVSFPHSKSAPNEVKKQFEDLAVGAPARWAPQALAAQARTAGTFLIHGHRRHLWVVPTRRGGYCYQFERAIGGCRQTASDRSIGRHGQLGVSFQIRGPQRAGWPIVQQISGDLTAPAAWRLTVRYANGASADVPFIWVSKPIAAGFFSYDIPTAHQTLAARAVSVTLQARDGRRLAVQTFPRMRPPHVVRPRPRPSCCTPRQRTLPTTPTLSPTQPIQQGSADGFTVTVGHNGAVQFTQRASEPGIRRLVGHSVTYSCFRLTREFGIFDTRGLGEEARFAAQIGFMLNGVGTPVDGCDIEGSAGHLWPDRDGSHSAVEIPLTLAGRRFFADRAAARDLALFVRSRRVRAIRREPPARAVRDLRASYGKQLARSRIRIATSGNELVFREHSSTGKTFTVTVRNGHIANQNLKPYAFVF